MRKIIVSNIVSLDGNYEGPGKNVMLLPMDGAFDSYNLERMKSASAVLLGENSYKLFSSFWPAMADNPEASSTHKEFSKIYNNIDKIVVSDNLSQDDIVEPWRDTTTIVGGKKLYAQLANAKTGPGKDIVIYGSRMLWNDLLASGLIDELHFIVGNVALGEGTPIFVDTIAYDDPKKSLHLVELRQFEGSENHLVKYQVRYR